MGQKVAVDGGDGIYFTEYNGISWLPSVNVAPLGKITIDAQPDAMNTTAPWTLTGPDSYSLTGAGDLILNDLVMGDYMITWGDLSGWTTPGSETKAVIDGGTTNFTGTYAQQTGIIFVYI